MFSVSNNGVLIYRTGTHSQENLLKLFSRQQGKITTLGKPADYIHPRLSPDAKRVAYHMLEPTTGRTDIWIQELNNANRYRLTLDPTRSRTPVWSPDGKKLAYYSLRSGKSALYIKDLNGVGTETEIREPDNILVGVPTDWTPDGSNLIVHERQRTGKFELSLVPVDPAKPSSHLLDIEGSAAGSAHISPNGWFAYESDESGDYEIYVTPYPPNFSGRVQVSTGGGRTPRWARGGKELFYLGSDHKLMVAELSFSKNSAEVTSLKPLLPQPILGRPDSYDVSKDGNWVVFEDEVGDHGLTPLDVVINWTSELKLHP